MNKTGTRGRKEGDFTVIRLPVGGWSEGQPFFVKIILKNQQSGGNPGMLGNSNPGNSGFFSSVPVRPPLAGPHGARFLSAAAIMESRVRDREFARLLADRHQRKPGWL